MNLPDDILNLIFEKLPPKKVVEIHSVCEDFERVIGDPLEWYLLHMRTIETPFIDGYLPGCVWVLSKHNLNYKNNTFIRKLTINGHVDILRHLGILSVDSGTLLDAFMNLQHNKINQLLDYLKIEVVDDVFLACLEDNNLEGAELLYYGVNKQLHDRAVDLCCSLYNLEAFKWLAVKRKPNIKIVLKTRPEWGVYCECVRYSDLKTAIEKGCLEVVKCFKIVGNVNELAIEAIKHNYDEILGYLLMRGSSDIDGLLNYASKVTKNQNIYKRLLGYKSFGTHVDTSVVLAILGKGGLLKMCLDRFTLNIDDRNGVLLTTAISEEYNHAVWMLLYYGADPNVYDGYPMLCAIQAQNLGYIKKLIRFGANVEDTKFIDKCVDIGFVDGLLFLHNKS